MVRGFASLVVLALLAVTLQALVFSGANFSDTDSASASFTAGSVSHDNPAAGSFVLKADPIWGGGSKTETLRITGGPDVPATYVLTCTEITDNPTSAAFSTVLQLHIRDVTNGVDLHYDVAANFVSANLGVIAPGEFRDYEFTLTYPAASANRSLMGASMTMDLEFVGVSL